MPPQDIQRRESTEDTEDSGVGLLEPREEEMEAQIADSGTPTRLRSEFDPQQPTTDELETTTETPQPAQEPINTAPQAIEGQVTAMTEEEPQEEDSALQQEVSRLSGEREQLLNQIDETFSSLAERGQRRQELIEEEGVTESRRELNEIDASIRETKRSYDNQIERIEDQAGLTQGQQNARIREIERQKADELADLGVVRQTRQQRFDSARALVDRKIENEFADEETRIQSLKFQFQQNKDLFSKKEQRLYQENIREEERQFQERKRQAEQLADQKLSIIETASKAGAPKDVIQNVWNSDNVAEARNAAQGYSQTTQEQLDIQLTRQQILESRAETRESLSSIQTGGQPTFEDMSDIRSTLLSEPSVKNLQDIRNGYQNVEQGTRLNNAQGDLAIVNGIAKMLDPGSVVRPGEFDTVGEAQGFLEQYTNVKTLTEGDRLKPKTRQEFKELGNALILTKGMAAKNTIEGLYGNQLEQKGVSVEQAAPIISDINRIVDQNKEEANEIIANQVGFNIDKARKEYSEEEIASFLQEQLKVSN